jgi:hypothetical protein
MHTECLCSKFFHIAHGILENKTELGLSDETFHKVKDLKISTKKDLIKAKAEIEITAVDIMAKMWEDSAELTEINKLIDKKYTLKKESMKTLVSAFVNLKKMVSKEQLNKLRTMCKSNARPEEKEKSCCN